MMLHGEIHYTGSRHKWQLCLYSDNRQLQSRYFYGKKAEAIKDAMWRMTYMPITYTEVWPRNGDEPYKIKND